MQSDPIQSERVIKAFRTGLLGRHPVRKLISLLPRRLDTEEMSDIYCRNAHQTESLMRDSSSNRNKAALVTAASTSLNQSVPPKKSCLKVQQASDSDFYQTSLSPLRTRADNTVRPLSSGSAASLLDEQEKN